MKNIEHNWTRIFPKWGGTSVIAEYSMTLKKNGWLNTYTIEAEVRGLKDCSPYLEVISVEAMHNNEETLIDSAVIDIFESESYGV